MTMYRLLGPLEVVRDGHRLELGGPKQRAVLAVLLLDAGRVVSTDRLVGAVWGDNPPASVQSSLQAYISNLRRAMRDDERATSPIVRQLPGYLADVAPEELDVTRFTAECDAAHSAAEDSDWASVVVAAERALSLWRGPLLVEYADEEWVRIAARALEERRLACEQNLISALIATGRENIALARSNRLVAEQPHDERSAWLRMMALHRCGRVADALEAYREHAHRMDEELGLDVGPALRDLHGAILRQDPDLAVWPGMPTEAGPPRVIEPDGAGAPAAADRESAQGDSTSGGFVGRTRERAVVEAALRPARPTATSWVVLTGDAGIGKSRLAEEIAQGWAADRGRVVRASCPDDESLPAWWPIRQLLGHLGLDPDVVLAVPAGVDADSARHTVYDRVRGGIAAAAQSSPLLLLVDDAHWADPTSLGFLIHLAEAHHDLGLGILLTARDGAGGAHVGRLLAAVARSNSSRQIALPPLSPTEVSILATRISGEQVGDSEVAQLAERTGGNPFFVCEYARLPAEERANGEVPMAVRSVLGRRLATLDPAVLQVMRTAALIGDTLDVNLLSRVGRLDREELADLLDEAADEHIIVASAARGGYTFAHALLRDELIASMSDVRRQRQHLRIAEALGPGTTTIHLTRRATHLVAALPLADPADALSACREAALDAEEQWDSSNAAYWWESAVGAFDLLTDRDRAERDELVIAQVAALARAGRGQTVLDVLDAALLDAVRNGRIGATGRLAAVLLRSTGSWPWAVYGDDPAPLLARLAALENLVRDDPAAHVRVLAVLATGSCYDPDTTVPDTLSGRALAIAENLGDPDVLADALLARAIAFAGIGIRIEESKALLERLAQLPHHLATLDTVIGHSLMTMVETGLGHTAAALDHIRAGAAGADLLRLPTCRAQLRWAEGVHALWTGDLDRAEALFDRAHELHVQTELYESGVFHIAVFSLRWVQGRVASDTSLEGVSPMVVPWGEALIHAARRLPDAADLVAAEIDREEPIVWTTHGRLTLLAHAAVDLGLTRHVADLRRRLEPVAAVVAILGQVGVVGTVALALARLCMLGGDLRAARRHLRQSLDIAERSGGRPALVQSRLVGLELQRLEGESADTSDIESVHHDALALGMADVAARAANLSGAVGAPRRADR